MARPGSRCGAGPCYARRIAGLCAPDALKCLVRVADLCTMDWVGLLESNSCFCAGLRLLSRPALRMHVDASRVDSDVVLVRWQFIRALGYGWSTPERRTLGPNNCVCAERQLLRGLALRLHVDAARVDGDVVQACWLVVARACMDGRPLGDGPRPTGRADHSCAERQLLPDLALRLHVDAARVDGDVVYACRLLICACLYGWSTSR